MNKIIYFYVIMCILIVTSCQKTEDNPAESIPKIKTITEYVDNLVKYTDTYEYDTSGRLKKVTNSKNIINEYTYFSDKIIRKGFNTDSQSSWSDTLFLNEKGLVKYTNSDKSVPVYNDEKYLVKRIYDTKTGLAEIYRISNGNTVESTYNEINVYSRITTKTFFPNSINTIGNENMGIFCFGKQDKNLESSIKSTTSTAYITFNFSGKTEYEFDELHRVIKRKITTDDLIRDKNNTYTTFTYY